MISIDSIQLIDKGRKKIAKIKIICPSYEPGILVLLYHLFITPRKYTPDLIVKARVSTHNRFKLEMVEPYSPIAPLVPSSPATTPNTLLKLVQSLFVRPLPKAQ